MDKSSSGKSGTSMLALFALLAALICQLVFASVYLSVLWNRAGYETILFVPVACVFILLVRLIQYRKEPKQIVITAGGLFWILVAGVCNGLTFLFADPWLLGTATVALMLAIDYSIRTPNGRRSLFGVAFPVVALLLPVMSLDMQVNDWTSKYAAYLSDEIMNLGKIHHLHGSINLRENEDIRRFVLDYSISPKHGFPLLFAFGLTLIGLFQRRRFHSLLLLVTTPLWAIFSMCVYLCGLAFFFQYLKIDITQEVLSGYELFLSVFAFLMVFSTDQFLAFWFAPVPTEHMESSSDMVKTAGAFWNGLLASWSLKTAQFMAKVRIPVVAVTVLLVVGIACGAVGFSRFLSVERGQQATLAELESSDFVPEPAWTKNKFDVYFRHSTSATASRQYAWSGYLNGMQCRYSLEHSLGRAVNPVTEFTSRYWQVDKTNQLEDLAVIVTMTKPSNEMGLVMFKELYRSDSNSRDMLGHFPSWQNPHLSDLFINHRVHAKMFVRYFAPPSDSDLEMLKKNFQRLVQVGLQPKS